MILCMAYIGTPHQRTLYLFLQEIFKIWNVMPMALNQFESKC